MRVGTVEDRMQQLEPGHPAASEPESVAMVAFGMTPAKLKGDLNIRHAAPSGNEPFDSC